MDQNHIAPSAFAPEAATDEPASSFNSEPADQSDEPAFASQEEADAYWKGMTHGIRCAGREPGHPHMPADFSLDLVRDGASPGLVSGKLLEAWPHNPNDEAHDPARRAPRHDGWTDDKERRFCETLANSGVVADACRAVKMSRDAAYAHRRRASGRAFALAWDAALLIARSRVSDDVMSRAIHGVIDRVYRNGELVAERHRYDNRLTMAVLTRLDRQAEGLGENAPVARAVAQEFDQFLDALPQGVEGAEAFVAARFAPKVEEPPSTLGMKPPPGSEQALLARLAAYRDYGVALPAEIDLDDLDTGEMEQWTEEQWARAEFSGMLEMLHPSEWPEAARTPGPDEPCSGTDCSQQPVALPGEERPEHGMCKLRNLYLQYHPASAAPAQAKADDFEGRSVWEGDDGEWATDFPPPAGFDGWEEGEPGDEDYKRELTEEELAAIGADEDSLETERADRLAAEHAARDRYFGFAKPPEGSDASAK